MIKCRKCGNDFEQTPHQLKKQECSCRSCLRIQEQNRRTERKLAGNPIKSVSIPYEKRRAKQLEYVAKPEVKKRKAEQQKRYRQDQKNRIKHEARWLVNRAIKSGRLIKMPCEICGNNKAQAHHDDYSKPLAIRWLCTKHHAEYHKSAAATVQS